VERFNKIHGDKYDYSLVEYINAKTKVKIICKIHGIFEQIPDGHLNNRNCYKCSNNQKLTNEEFINESRKIHGYKYDYSLVDYKNAKTKIKIICSIHGVFEQIPDNHNTKKYGCPKCSKSHKLTTKEFINESKKIHGRYDYSLVDYKNTNTKVIIICLTHGIFEQKPEKHLIGNGCPKCKESHGERKISNFLEEHNISFKQEYVFDSCRNINPLPFDFYLPNYNTCIEYDGIQHFEPVEFFGGKDSLVIRKGMDKIKTQFCTSNKIDIIRIKYTENIDDMLYHLIK